MRKVIFLFFISVTITGKAQNLIPNGDFEQYDGCPTFFAQLDSAAYWFNPTLNLPGTTGTPDYLNQCGDSLVNVPSNNWGYQPARSGVAYSGIYLWADPTFFPNYREYIEVPLLSALVTHTCYHFEMYVNLANSQTYTTDRIAVYFSDTVISGINNYLPLPFTPQIESTAGFITDTLNWTLIEGNYFASGGENYLIIGNFRDDANTDTIPTFYPNWYNTIYMYIDDVSLTPCTGIQEQMSTKAFNISPNPSNGIFKINFQNNLSEKTIQIFDLTGKILYKRNLLPEINEQYFKLPELSDGIYNCVITSGKERVCKKIAIIKD